MKLYTYSAAPNPQRIELLIREKQLEIPRAYVDLSKGEQLLPEYRAKNPNCDVPMLELDDGTCISQVPAIAAYLEDKFPAHPVFGHTAEQRALVTMWEHLCCSNGFLAVGDILRNTAKGMKDRALVGPHNYAQIPELAERGRLRLQNFYDDMNTRLATVPYMVGDFFSFADITAWVTCNFAGWIKQRIPEHHQHLLDWHARVGARPAFQNPA